MDSEDGQVFVKNLAYFVRTHERALANALQQQRSKHGQQAAAGASTSTAVPATSISLSEALSRPSLFSSHSIKPAKLTLTPHHLFYLLSKFEDLGVDIGPMNVRLENLQHDATPSNYVSFLGHAPRSRGKQSDADSLKSVSSVRSAMSSMSSFWSSLTLTDRTAKAEKRMAQHREDIRYLYSSFTILPALKLSPDYRARLIAGYEEFPFDTAVPLFAFKNVSNLEICDLDFRQFHGWDRLAEQLHCLTVRRANVDDPIDLLQHIVLDDLEKRRKRSFKTNFPATPSTPGSSWPASSPKARQIELARTMSAPGSPFFDLRRSSKGSPPNITLDRQASSDGRQYSSSTQSQQPDSPARGPGSRHGSLNKHGRNGSLRHRRHSNSSGSSAHESTPRHSTTDLLSMGVLPSSKWQFLRHLSLAENGLTSLTTVSLAPIASTLQSLDLSSNLFSEVPEALASLTHLRALNLSNCMIESLQTLSRNPLPAIATLSLRANRLSNLSGIERLYSLEKLDVRDNRLREPEEIARLTGFPNISDVYVARNPFTRTHSDYRVRIYNLFRKRPGNVHDVSIDTTGPSSSERSYLVDRAPESPSVPVIKPPLEDEEDDIEPQAVEGATTTESDFQPAAQQPQALGQRLSHRRAASDVGPQNLLRKKRAPRRRIVELSQAESPSSPTSQQLKRELADATPKTPTDSDQAPTPEPPPTTYHTAPTTQVAPLSPPQRPTVRTSFHSPTPAPRIRDPSDDDDDDSPVRSPQDLGHSDMYRQKIEALKADLGPGWLTALNDNGVAKQDANDRSFSPSSRTSTIRQDAKGSRGVGVGGRTLG